MSFKLVPWSRVQPELILLATSLLLLVLVAMSSILKGVYFFELAAHISTSVLHTNVGSSVRFGVWGYCWSGLDVSYVPPLSSPGFPSHVLTLPCLLTA